MRICIVGVGRIGARHAEAVSAHPAVSELLIADSDPGRARDVAQKLDATAVGSLDDAFDGVDAVVIAATTSAHEDLIVKAVRAGVPAFCEKPVAADIAGTRRVVDEVGRTGVAVQIGFQRRFDAGYSAGRDALRTGELGDLHRVHLVTADPAPPPAGYVASSGGIFRDCHIHDFDILRWVTGREVVEVHALGSNRGAGFFRDADDVDNCAALLRLDDDTLVTMQGSRYNGAGYDVRMELAGSKATHVIGLDDQSPLTSAERGVAFPVGQPWAGFGERFALAYLAEINAFIEVANGRATSPCTVVDALEALYVADATDLSRREGRSVRIDEVRR